MNGFRLHDPMWLLALAPVALALAVQARRASARALVFSSVDDLRALPVSAWQRLRAILPWLRGAGLLLVVGALARPQRGVEETRVRVEGIDILMAIDRSGSMAAMDFVEDGERVTRLDAVKSVFRRFVAGDDRYEGRTDDRIGLVVFGGYAEQRCPLTLDHGALLDILGGVRIPGEGLSPEEARLAARIVPDEGDTAIGDGLARAVAGLRDSDAESRVVILLSDGENRSGVLTPEQAAALAEQEGVRVYTIGIGSNGLAPFKVIDQFGRTGFRTNPVVLDEATLRRIAETTGGRYFNARDRDSLEAVVEEIDRLETGTREGVVYTDYRELFAVLLAPGIVLLVLERLLAVTRLLRVP